MLRSLALVSLFVSAPVWACPNNPDCTSDKCQMKSADETAEAAASVDAAEGTTLTVAVAGMKCGACSDKVIAALNDLDGVNAAAVDHVTGTAEVKVDAEKCSSEQVLAAITALGFKASLPDS